MIEPEQQVGITTTWQYKNFGIEVQASAVDALQKYHGVDAKAEIQKLIDKEQELLHKDKSDD